MPRLNRMSYVSASRSISAMQLLFPDPDAPKPNPVAPLDPMTLPALQQAALLQMHESHVKRMLTGIVLEDCQDKPGHPDYAALASMGLCDRNEGKRYHDLTVAGIVAAKTLERSLCKQHGIHLLLGPFGGGGPTVSYRCPCGWSTQVRNSTTAPNNGRARWNAHVSTAQGMSKLVVALKPPQMAEG